MNRGDSEVAAKNLSKLPEHFVFGTALEIAAGPGTGSANQQEVPAEEEQMASRRAKQMARRDELIAELMALQAQQGYRVLKQKGDMANTARAHLFEIRILENAQMQKNVAMRIRELQKDIDRSSDSLNQDSDDFQIASANNRYFDPGNHWCSSCDLILPSWKEYLLHLHAQDHHSRGSDHGRRRRQSGDLADTGVESVPWESDLMEEGLLSAPLHGLWKLRPVQAWSCDLCGILIGGVEETLHHLRCCEHNTNYLKFIVSNPNWETKNAKGMLSALKGHRKRILADQELRDPPDILGGVVDQQEQILVSQEVDQNKPQVSCGYAPEQFFQQNPIRKEANDTISISQLLLCDTFSLDL